jgi:fatty-acyl-CoA synthase
MKKLSEAGALDPKGPLAMFGILPWLVGRGPSMGILSRMNATVLGDKTAIVDRNGTLSFRELDERANQAARLLEGRGVRPGGRTGLLLRNGREIVELLVGAQKCGVITCPFNTWAKPKELRNTIDESNIDMLVYDTAHSEQVRKCAPEGLPLLFVGDPSDAVDGSDPYEEELGAHPSSALPPFTRDRGSPRVVIQTSGTTGKPKGAARDAASAGIGALVDVLDVVPFRRDDICYLPTPMFHSFGLFMFVVSTALGTTMVLPDSFDPARSLELIEKHRATVAALVPVMIRRILSLDDESRSRHDLDSLRILIASGSVLSEDVRREATKLFGDVLYDLYGSTEVGWVAIAQPEDIVKNPKTVGKPLPSVELGFFSPDEEQLEPGETGEIFVKSELTFEGYTSGEQKKTIGEYMSIGDVGRIDDDGYLFIEGRADEMVVVGGENIYPVEIEQVIEDVDGVSEVAVLGIPDLEYGEVLAAFVVGTADGAAVEEMCRNELASYKVPRRIEVVDELPRTSTGKVLKRELVELAQDRAEGKDRSK